MDLRDDVIKSQDVMVASVAPEEFQDEEQVVDNEKDSLLEHAPQEHPSEKKQGYEVKGGFLRQMLNDSDRF